MKRRKAIGTRNEERVIRSNLTKRSSISEVMTDIESKPIKEKKLNTLMVKVNPTMGDAT